MIESGGWQVIWYEGDLSEVHPLNDLKAHLIGNPQCWCRPAVWDNCLVHNSMDQRELYEPGALKMN